MARFFHMHVYKGEVRGPYCGNIPEPGIQSCILILSYHCYMHVFGLGVWLRPSYAYMYKKIVFEIHRVDTLHLP